MNDEEIRMVEEFKVGLEQIKKNKEEYFQLVTTGHCAICLCALEVPPEMIAAVTTMTCDICQKNGLVDIFQKGLVCGLELQKWKKAVKP
jgi:hypothetical protein